MFTILNNNVTLQIYEPNIQGFFLQYNRLASVFEKKNMDKIDMKSPKIR